MARSRGQRTAAGFKEALHDPVLERVEGDDREPPAGREHLLRRSEAAFELAELVVDVDPDRLEGAGRRILLHSRMVAERLAHDFGQLPRALDGPGGDDRPRDPARPRLLAIMIEDVGDLFLVRLVD